MSGHEMQHPDPPTWCVHCGTFDAYCVPGGCTAGRTGEFDNRTEAGAARIWRVILGRTSEPKTEG